MDLSARSREDSTKSTQIKSNIRYLKELFNLTDNEIKILHNDIRQSSTTQLRKVLKEDIPVELDDMINYELYIREFS